MFPSHFYVIRRYNNPRGHMKALEKPCTLYFCYAMIMVNKYHPRIINGIFG